MKLIVRKGKKIIFKFIILSIIIYGLIAFVNQYVKLRSQTEKLKALNEQILVEKDKNKEALNMLKKVEAEEKQEASEDKPFSGNVRVFENIIK